VSSRCRYAARAPMLQLRLLRMRVSATAELVMADGACIRLIL